MPMYEYQCSACQKVHEVMQKFSDAPMTTCPECGGAVAKMISMSSFALKGTGWYTTDYKRKSMPASGAGSSGPTSSPTDNAAKGSDSATTNTPSTAPAAPASSGSTSNSASPSPAPAAKT